MPSEIKLEPPHIDTVKEAVSKVKKEYPNFEIHNKILEDLFKDKEHNKNEDLEKVLLKVVLLNTLYSAGVKNIHMTDMANHIIKIYKQKEYVDNPCLVVGDTSESRDHCLGLVNEIAKIEVEEKSKKVWRNYYSFASKFCFFQNNEFFFIYDSYVTELLLEFQKKFKDKYREKLAEYTEFTRESLKNYETFYTAVKQLIDVFELQNGSPKLSNREIDIYLWSYGKDIIKEKKAQKEKVKKEAEENKSNL